MDPLSVLFAAFFAFAWLVTALVNLTNYAHVRHVGGAWIGLAHAFGQGQLYPPLYDAEAGTYGGTRFAPIPIVLQSTMTQLLGDPLMGGKTLHVAYTFLLIAAMIFLLRQLRVRWSYSLLIASLFLGVRIGWESGLGIRHDALAAALQLWALAAYGVGARSQADDPRSTRQIAVAALLCALAPLSKFSAVFAGMALAIHLAVTDRRRFVTVFLPVTVAVGPGGLLVTEWLSGGAFFETLSACLFGGAGPGGDASVLASALGIQLALYTTSWVGWSLMPVALFGLIVCVRRAPVLALAGGWSVAVTLYASSSPGVATNHLVEPLALGLVLIGAWVAYLDRFRNLPGGSWIRVGPTVTDLCWPAAGFVAMLIIVAASAFNLDRYTREFRLSVLSVLTGDGPVLRGLEAPGTAFWPDDVRARLGAELQTGPVLSGDASFAVYLGQDPIVLDPFMLRVIAAKNESARQALVDRIRAQEFSAIVTRRGFAAPPTDDDPGFRGMHWGPEVGDAIRAHYRFEPEWMGVYAIWRRRPRDVRRPVPPESGTTEVFPMPK